MARLFDISLTVHFILLLVKLAGISCVELHVQGREQKIPESENRAFTALTLGDHLVYTFDGQLFQMPAPPSDACAYTLLRDTGRGDVTVVKHNSGVTVITKHITVTIDNAYHVFVNNPRQPSDLPLHSWNGSTWVTRHGNMVRVDSNLGLSVICDPQVSTCQFTLSNKSIDRPVRGLLGTLTSRIEQSRNDGFKTRTGELTDDITQFVNSFEVSGRPECRSRSSIHVDNSPPGAERLARCQSLFASDLSPLSACYNTVHSHNFLMACKQSNSANVCDYVDAYTTICKFRQVTIPTTSTECNICGQTRSTSSTWIQHVKRMVDVVLVVPPNHYGYRLTRALHLVLRDLRDSLRKDAAVWQFQVGLVSMMDSSTTFDRTAPNTFNGSQFTEDLDRMSQVLTSGPRGSSHVSMTTALTTATHYHFRPAAVRVVIATVSLDDVITDDLESIHNVQRAMRRNNILLYVVNLNTDSDQDVVLRHTPPFGATTVKFNVFRHRQGHHALSRSITHDVLNRVNQCQQCSCVMNSRNEQVTRCEQHRC